MGEGAARRKRARAPQRSGASGLSDAELGCLVALVVAIPLIYAVAIGVLMATSRHSSEPVFSLGVKATVLWVAGLLVCTSLLLDLALCARTKRKKPKKRAAPYRRPFGARAVVVLSAIGVLVWWSRQYDEDYAHLFPPTLLIPIGLAAAAAAVVTIVAGRPLRGSRPRESRRPAR